MARQALGRLHVHFRLLSSERAPLLHLRFPCSQRSLFDILANLLRPNLKRLLSSASHLLNFDFLHFLLHDALPSRESMVRILTRQLPKNKRDSIGDIENERSRY